MNDSKANERTMSRNLIEAFEERGKCTEDWIEAKKWKLSVGCGTNQKPSLLIKEQLVPTMRKVIYFFLIITSSFRTDNRR